MRLNFDKIKVMQKDVANRVTLEGIKLEGVKYVAGFEVVYSGGDCTVGAAVIDLSTMEVVERKCLDAKQPMNYIPGLNAFRAGPLICQLYYDLEYDPDVILVVGEGVSHPERCGTASFVGVELAKPTIGVAKSYDDKHLENGTFIVDGEVVGKLTKTKEHARPVFVSVGNMIDLDTASEIVGRMIVPPHKMPEPLHVARKVAKKRDEKQNNIGRARQKLAEEC